MSKVNVIGNINPSGNGMNGCVFGVDGLSPTLTTNKGEGVKILEPQILSYSRDSKGKVVSRHTKDVANTLHSSRFETTTQYVVEPRIISTHGYTKGKESESCPTITARSWECNNFLMEPIIAAIRGRNPDNPSERRRSNGMYRQRLELGGEVSNTLTSVQKDNLVIEPAYRIRKLTERECFRLMDVSEEDIDKIQQSGVSRSQQYKMAGNSIVVSCLFHIFRKMFVETHNENPQLTLF